MAVKKYRFKWRGPSSADISRESGVQVTRGEPQPSVLGITGVVYEDYSVEESQAQTLKDYLSMTGTIAGGWEYVGEV